MSDTPVNLSGGLPETVLPPGPGDSDAELQAAGTDREAVARIVAAHPRSLAGWATLGDLAGDPIDAYACYRVGYHRGLDTLRANGWRGSGYVRWRHETNRGFLRALDGLRRMAAEIGELDEAERCDDFLHQLDPDWDRR
jgi:DNA-binding transcriptional LysR family regulator